MLILDEWTSSDLVKIAHLEKNAVGGRYVREGRVKKRISGSPGRHFKNVDPRFGYSRTPLHHLVFKAHISHHTKKIEVVGTR